MIKTIKHALIILMSLASFTVLAADYLDGIAAIVEDDIILDSELVSEVRNVAQRLQTNKVQLPTKQVLYEQVLERLIVDKLQLQLAKKVGINVTDENVNASLRNIARQNKLDFASFKAELIKEGLSFEDFKANVHKEIMINQLRNREIGGRLRVSKQEVEHFLETQMSREDLTVQYLLGHILLGVSESASAAEIQEQQQKAVEVVTKLRAGNDFKQMAVSVSTGANALQGGDLGWRTLDKVPSLFVDVVKTLVTGDISEPIRSPSGFHILKVMETNGVKSHVITETHVRHILIKTNEIVSDEEARQRLEAIAARIEEGDDFSDLAKANSADTGSAIKGGDLSWVMPGLLVPKFEQAMTALALNELSPPIQTQFGWHLIQVLERRSKDNSKEHKYNEARDVLRQQKIEEQTELWLRRLRDEAYVDVRLGVFNAS